MTDEKTAPEMDDAEETALAELDENEVAELEEGEETDQDEAAEADEEEDEDELQEMGLMDHLDELRVRFVRAAIAFVIGTCACYAFAEQLFGYLIIPLKEVIGETDTLIYTGLAEGFITYIKLAAIAGFFATSPYIFYQFWAFVAPGLYKEERRWVIPIAIFTALFFVTGSCFGYFKVFPIAFEFFAGFENEHIKLLPAVKEYLSLAIKLLFAFGFAFELPLFIFFLARLGVVSSKGLREKRKYAMLMSFVVAAALTPPDPFSQGLMAGPLIILYEIGVWVAHFFGKKEPRAKAADDGAEESA